MSCNNPKLDLVNINAYIKFAEILLIGSQDNDGKRKNMMNEQTEIPDNPNPIQPPFQSGIIISCLKKYLLYLFGCTLILTQTSLPTVSNTVCKLGNSRYNIVNNKNYGRMERAPNDFESIDEICTENYSS